MEKLKNLFKVTTEKITQSVAAKVMLTFLASMGLATAAHAAGGGGDLLAGEAAKTVSDTLGKDSTVATWLLLAEVFMGAFLYIKTKNILMLFGIIIVIVYTTFAFGLIG